MLSVLRGVSSDTIDYLFSSTMANTQARMDSLGSTMLGQGIDYFQGEKYEQSVNAFRYAAALSPSSDNAANAYDYMGQAYLKLEKTAQAIKTYKDAIRLFPTDETFHKALGDIYMGQGMQEEALAEYEAAVSLNSNDAESQYSLGQSYFTAGELDKAREAFKEVVRISPNDASGYYGLGQVARAGGDLDEAVSYLTRSEKIDKDFELAYRELGYAYADMGEFDKAEDQLSILEANDSDYVTDLEDYITQVTPARITAAVSSDGFATSLGPKTEVSDLSSKLADADKSKLFSMTFTFSKEMDTLSVIKSDNWQISRAGLYNFGVSLPSTEAYIASKPAYVTYDEESNTATVYFRVSQNATADATIDPSNIAFKFKGLDAYGKTMDTSADEYSGFSGIA